MAKSPLPFTWKNGFRQPSSKHHWESSILNEKDHDPDQADYVTPPSLDLLTSTVHNSLGLNILRTWPTLYNGTNSPHGLPSWWKPSSEVDVLICGAGPSGLEVALSLVRQGVSFRIIDKAEAPLIAGRADGVQPRFLETLNSWGLAAEVAEEGPLIERTAVYKDGKRLLFGRSHQSDSRYRGLHIITQGQIERIYIRDLMRHQKLVERSTTITKFNVGSDEEQYPVSATLWNSKSGKEEVVKARFLVGSDGASSTIRKQLDIPFDGVSTDIYWGIMDCQFESDYPHAWVFGSVISSQHGGCVIIPREDGYIRLYTQLNLSQTGHIAQSRQLRDPSLAESGGQVDISTITPDEVLEQANKIFAPYTIEFKAPLSWFAIWKISERVARSFSSPDMRVHLVGDAAHVHSVMGAFGLNASIMDAANLAWKIGLCSQKKANPERLLSTYDSERRLHAAHIIHVSGSYLRFVCNASLPLAELAKVGADLENRESRQVVSYDQLATDETETESESQAKDLNFLGLFFATHGPFLLGVDAPYGVSLISPKGGDKSTIGPLNGVRAPNPRVCFDVNNTGYLYDKMVGAAIFHILIFASNLKGPVRKAVGELSRAMASMGGFYHKFGGSGRFNVVLVLKCMPFEMENLLGEEEFEFLNKYATIVYDDRAPDEDAHTCYEVCHGKGGVVIVRPDLWIGTGVFAADVDAVEAYFSSFLVA